MRKLSGVLGLMALAALSSACGHTDDALGSGAGFADGGATGEDVDATVADAMPALDDAGADSADGGDASPDAGPLPFCPLDPDGGCAADGTVCEYGADMGPLCNALGTCSSGRLVFRDSGAAGCPTVDAGVGPLCPGYRESVYEPQTDGGPECAAPQGTTCDYTEGRCQCGMAFGAPAWNCVVTAPTCPTIRPRLGTPCSTEGMECNYGACDLTPRIDFQGCVQGIWKDLGGPGPCY